MITLYVDGILLAWNNLDVLQEIKSWSFSIFFGKDISEASFILGVRIVKNSSKKLLGFSGENYIHKIFERIWIHNSKHVDTPIKNDERLVTQMIAQKHMNKRIIGFP